MSLENKQTEENQEKRENILTHLDRDGAAQMVDVGAKSITQREAIAQAEITMLPTTLTLLLKGDLPKGDALQVARVAGIMASKQTPQLIPLCHPIPISGVNVDFEAINEKTIRIRASVRNTAQTGVEMEALTACSIAALTLYDMAKAIDRGMEIQHIRLEEKKGGKSGHWIRR